MGRQSYDDQIYVTLSVRSEADEFSRYLSDRVPAGFTLFYRELSVLSPQALMAYI